jgi:drug/metabolite transporter (DMT)-like permease
MSAIIGTLLIASGIVMFSWSVLQYRRPNPPSWTRQENYAIGFSMAITAAFSLGFASYVHLIALEAHESFGALEWGAIVVCYVAVAIFLLALRRWWQTIRNETPAMAVVAGNENLSTGGKGPSPAAPKGHAGTRAKAA